MEKFEKKLAIYCLFDKETEKYDSFTMSYSDEEARDWFLDQLSHVAFDLASKADTLNYNKLFENLKSSCFIRLAIFDEIKGIFNNEQVVLIDYIEKSVIENLVKFKIDLASKFKDIKLSPNEKKEG